MPIFSTIAAGIAAAGTALASFGTFLSSGTILSGVVKMGLSLAANFAIGAIMGQQSVSQAVQREVQYGTDLHRQVVLGTVGTSGHAIFSNGSGSGNRTVHDVLILSNFQIQGINRVRDKDGKWATPDAPDVDGYRRVGTPRIRFKTYLGSLTQTADAGLIAVSKPAGRWTVNHRGAGQAYVIARSGLHYEDLQAPWQGFYEVVGPKLYDWRYDTTAGGAGPNRFNNPATWTGRHDNPVLQMYLLERGVWQNGNLIVGKAVNVSRLPLDKWTVAANICDEIVNGKPRYSSHLIAKAGPNVTHKSNMEPLWNACAASWYEGADGEYPIINTVQAIAVTITDADLMPEEPFRFSEYRSRSELVNTATGSFVSPDNFYDSGPIKERNLAWALAEDGEILGTSIDFSAVTDSAQADRLLDIQLIANRYQANGEICVHPKFIQIKVGQWIAWNSARYGNRTFQVLGRSLGPPSTGYRNVHWKLQEVAAPIFTPGTTVTVVPSPIGQGAPVNQSELAGFVGNPVFVTNSDGVQRAGFKFDWLLPEDESVTHVAIKYWPTNQPTAVFTHPPVPVGDLTTTITASVVQRTQYRFQYWLASDPPRVPVLTAPITITSPTLNKEFYPISIDAVNDDIKGLARWAEQLGREVWDRIQALDIAAASEVMIAWDHRQEIRRELTATTGDMSAKFDEKITVATGPTSALAQQITAVDARFANYAPVTVTDAITTRVTANEGVLNTYGQRLTTVEAGLDGKASNSALMALTAEVEDNGEAIASSNSAILTLQNDLSGKVSNDVFNVLASEVEDQGDTLASTNSATTTLQNALAGYNGDYAVANAFSAMDTEITDIGDVVAAQANRVDGVYAALGGNSSEIMVAFSAVAGPAGYSTFGIVGKNTAGGAVRDASAFLMVPSDPAKPTRWAFTSDEFLIRDSAGNLAALFKAGETYIDAGFIRELNVTNLTVTGKFNGADIVGDGTLGAGQIAHNQLTYWATGSGSRGPGLNTPGVPSNVANVTVPVNNENPSPVTLSLVGRINGGNPGTLTVRIRRSFDNSIVNTWSYTGPSVRDIVFYSLDAQIQQGTYDYVFEYVGSFAGSFNVTMTVQVSRR